MRTKIVKTKIPLPLMSDKTMVKLSLDVQTILNIPAEANEASVGIPMSYINGTGFDVQNFPSGLLNWANFYGAFRVLGSKIRTEWFQLGSSTTANGVVPITCAVFPSQNWIAGTGVATTNAYSQAYVRYRTMGTTGNTVPGPTNHTLVNYMSSKKMFGQKVTEENDYQQSWIYTGTNPNTATTLSNPSETADWILYVSTADGAVITTPEPGSNILVVSRVTYYVQLEDRLQQPQNYGPAP